MLGGHAPRRVVVTDFELERVPPAQPLRRPPGLALLSHHGRQISLQSDGVVVIRIARAVHKRHVAAARGLNDGVSRLSGSLFSSG